MVCTCVCLGGRSHQLEDRSLHHRSSRDRDNDHSSDDVVHCLCGSDIDEGFMIQVCVCACCVGVCGMYVCLVTTLMMVDVFIV